MTEQQPPISFVNAAAVQPGFPQFISLREMGEYLVKRFDLHQGLWDVTFEIQIGVGQFGQNPADVLPGSMTRISRVGITPAVSKTHLTVDAAEVNPVPTG
jgi:hypothetical protein